MPRHMLKWKVLIGAPVIVEEVLMIIGPLSIVSAETKKSMIRSARETKAQEGYFIGWMLSNDQHHRVPANGKGVQKCAARRSGACIS